MSGRTPYMIDAWKAGVDEGSPTESFAALELAGHEQPPRIAHAAAGERAVEDPAREAVDLDDQEASARARRRAE